MYKLKKKRFNHKAGTIVYDAEGHDYGLARDDTYDTGIKHISVTLKKDGSNPFFTVPLEDLELIKE
jgi:hypothetical protein